MGSFKLIEYSSIGNYTKAEKLSLLKRFMALLPKGESDAETPGVVSLADEGVPALNISAEQVARMNAIIDGMEERTLQSNAAAETPEMQAVEADRDTAGNYIVRRILNPDQLPLAAERDAARAMEPFFRGYANVASLPVAQETEVINGLLRDLAKPEFAEQVVTLGLTAAIAELKRLNDKYAELSAARDKELSARTDNVSFSALADEAQDLLDDMIALANASSLLQPSDEASAFVRDANFLFKQARTAYKQRAKKDAPADGGDKTPSGPAETPDTETPDTQEPDGDDDEGQKLPFEPVDPDKGGEGEDTEETPSVV